MQPSDNHELNDRELDAMLPAWKAPKAPAHLRTAVFPAAPMPWWQRVWTVSIRIPLPVACGMAIVLALLIWRWSTPVTVYRDRVMPALQSTEADAGMLRPVTEFRPRVIRSGDAQN